MGAGQTVHALVDIAESMRKVYCALLPDLMASTSEPNDVFEDKMWDIRAEFRHIEYHMRDAKICEF